mmetsp:Transcript_13818/g.21352  ORF Transcript_13818/g.21352 Transcript_13818/m.21352 type:complete len:280 (+) Transcript_13818:525-1364(+)
MILGATLFRKRGLELLYFFLLEDSMNQLHALVMGVFELRNRVAGRLPFLHDTGFAIILQCCREPRFHKLLKGFISVSIVHVHADHPRIRISDNGQRHAIVEVAGRQISIIEHLVCCQVQKPPIHAHSRHAVFVVHGTQEEIFDHDHLGLANPRNPCKVWSDKDKGQTDDCENPKHHVEQRMASDVLCEVFVVNDAFNVGVIPEVSVEQYKDREKGIPFRPYRKIVPLPQVIGIKEHPHSASVEPVICSLDCPRGNTVFFRQCRSTASWNVDKQDVGSGG